MQEYEVIVQDSPQFSSLGGYGENTIKTIHYRNIIHILV